MAIEPKSALLVPPHRLISEAVEAAVDEWISGNPLEDIRSQVLNGLNHQKQTLILESIGMIKRGRSFEYSSFSEKAKELRNKVSELANTTFLSWIEEVVPKAVEVLIQKHGPQLLELYMKTLLQGMKGDISEMAQQDAHKTLEVFLAKTTGKVMESRLGKL